MIRVHVLVEGQTEEAFCNRVLAPHLETRGVWISPRLLPTKPGAHSRRQKCGWLSYAIAKNELQRSMRADHGEAVWFTTMLDRYGIPPDSPELTAAQQIPDPWRSVEHLERAFHADVVTDALWRFIPYIQLHEFESLILADPRALNQQFLEHDQQIADLVSLSGQFSSPEEIDDGEETAPSKRIIARIPEYRSRKVAVGAIVTGHIGLPRLRERCRHFDAWILRLENLSAPSNSGA